MAIKKVGVLGCGLMGSGIAQVSAMAGYDVVVLEADQKFIDKGFAGIEKSLGKLAERPVEKGGITAEQKDAARARLKGTLNNKTSPIAISSSRPSSRTPRSRRRRSPNSMAS